jgi:hypothetical protein
VFAAAEPNRGRFNRAGADCTGIELQKRVPQPGT